VQFFQFVGLHLSQLGHGQGEAHALQVLGEPLALPVAGQNNHKLLVLGYLLLRLLGARLDHLLHHLVHHRLRGRLLGDLFGENFVGELFVALAQGELPHVERFDARIVVCCTDPYCASLISIPNTF
jgi:hypothetical protein